MGKRSAVPRGPMIGAEHSFADCPQLEVMVHPGGHGTRRVLDDRAHLD